MYPTHASFVIWSQTLRYDLFNYIRKLVCIGSTLFLVACANLSTGNLFSHYSAQNNTLHNAVKVGDYSQAEQALPEAIAGDILDNLERGRVYLLSQQYQNSQNAFKLSDQAVTIQQRQATVSISDSATSIGSLAVNDNLNDYQPSDYELGFLHLYLGLNYLYANDLEGALVEMRRANQVQEQARASREDELESAQQQMSAQGLTPNLGSVLANYPDAGGTLQSIQNGYLLYLSALLYEADRDLNSAYVDYRRALAVMPENQQVIDGAKRVAKRLGMKSDLTQLEKRYGKVTHLDSDQARVIVIEEQGVVAALEGWKQTLPIYDSRGDIAWYTISLPYYPSLTSERQSVLTLNGDSLDGSKIVDVDQMAQYDLSERMPSIIVRQALRVWAKDRLRKETTKGDDVGNLLFNAWNTLTEQPDTRSWLTLPSKVYTASSVVSAGSQSLNIDGKKYAFNVSAGNTVLVWLSRQGDSSVVWHKQLGNIR